MIYLLLDSHGDVTPNTRDLDGKPMTVNPLRDPRVRRALFKAIGQMFTRIGLQVAVETLPRQIYGTRGNIRFTPCADETDVATMLDIAARLAQ